MIMGLDPSGKSRTSTLPRTCSGASALMAAESVPIALSTGERLKSAGPACCRALDSLLAWRVDRVAAGFQGEFHALDVGRDVAIEGRLKIAVVARGFETGAAELRGNVFRGDIETGRGRSPTLELIGGQEGNIGLQTVGRQTAGDLLYGRLGLRGGDGGQQGHSRGGKELSHPAMIAFSRGSPGVASSAAPMAPAKPDSQT